MRLIPALFLCLIITACNANSAIYEISTSAPAVKSSIDRFTFDKYNLIDGKLKTSFQINTLNSGIGEWISFKLNSPKNIQSISIYNGFQLIDPEFGDLYYLNSRIKRIKVTINNVKSFEYTIPDSKSRFEIPLVEPDVQLVRISILDVYKGSKWGNDLAISDITFNTVNYPLFILLFIIAAGGIAAFYFRHRIAPLLNQRSNKADNVNFNKEAYEKGMAFEKFVAGILSKQSNEFSIVKWTNDVHTKHKGIYVEDDNKPDFLIRHIPTNTQIYIECKYRSNILFNEKLQTEVINWSTRKTISKYQAIEKQEKIPVYIVLGIKGTPDKPEHLFCLPLKDANYTDLTINMLKKFSHIPVDKEYRYTDGQLI